MGISNDFYPSIKTLISKDSVSQKIGTVQGGLDLVLDNLFYKELILQQSRLKDSIFASFSIVSYKRLGLEFPGTGGLSLILNPGIDSQTFTEFPVSLSLQNPVKRFLSKVSITSLSQDPNEIFSLLRKLADVSDGDIILAVLNTFFGQDSTLESFVIEVNSKHGTSLSIDYSLGNEKLRVEDLVVQINSTHSFTKIIYDDYLYDADFDKVISNIINLFEFIFGDFTIEDVLELFIPVVEVSIDSISLALEFPRTFFIPLDINGDIIEDENVKTLLSFDVGSVVFSSIEGFSFFKEGNFNFQKSQLGNSGFTLELNRMKLDLSRDNNIPEASADGRPNDFIGAYITEGVIGFPQFWNHDDSNSTGQLITRNLLVGTGGISGTIGLEAKTNGNPSPLISARFGEGFKVSLDAFDLTFQQNSIIESNIHGSMKIPGFKDASGDNAEINIDAWIGTNGEFSVTASEDQGITALSIPDILDVRIDSLTVGRKEDRFFVAVSGAIEFEDQEGTIGKFLPDAIDIQKLIVWQDGEVELEGGALVLPSALTLKIGPVELSITAIGFGSHTQMYEGNERKYKFFEFSGGVSINSGGVDARGDGIKFYYTVDNDDDPSFEPHRFVRIQGIGIDIMIPGNSDPKDAALILSGYLAMKDPAPGNEAAGTEYAGSIEFVLPRLKMGGSASMRLNPKVPAFVVDIGLEIATPIPLGATGLGIYGFRALVGQRYVATKNAAGVPDDGEWWQYYKAKISPDYKEGIQVSKFDQTKGFSLGAGVSLATSTDSGKTFSSKLFFLLSLPEVFMFQGQGQILKERIGLDSTNDPPFFALLAISKQSVETAFGINYKLPDDKRPGSIAKVDALIEINFFFGNASGWYVNIGKDLPESRRVNVRLLELFDAYFYLMISASGMKAGAGAKFEFDKKFGPLRAELGAYLDVAGQIAFKPKQYGASIQMGGKVGLYIFKFGFSISVDAGLAAEAPKPFVVTGSLKACVKVLRKDRCAKFQFSWIKDSTLDVGENQILDRPVAAKAINMLTRESFDLYNTGNALTSLSTSSIDNYVVPIDSFIDIEFLKGVLPSTAVKNEFGGNTQGAKYTDFVSPQKAKNSRVLHEYHLHNLKIYTWNGTSWVPYDIYDAAAPLSLAPFVTTNLANLKKGYWQYQQPKLHNKLRVMAQSPLSFLSQGSGQPGDVLVEDLGITTESIYCPPEELVETCVNFNELGEGSQTGDIMMEVNQGQVYHYDHFLFQLTGGNSNIIYLPYGNFANALHLNDNNQLNLVFNEPMSFVSLILQSEASSVEVQYYKNVPQPNLAPTNLPQFDYQLIESRTVSATQLNNPVIYENINESVDKVVVIGGSCENVDDPKELVCNDELTDQAKDLQNFLNVQLQNRHLTESFFLYPDKNTIYNGVFQGSSLYPAVSNPKWIIDKRIEKLSENVLVFTIRDAEKFSCQFYLESVKDSVDWRDIVEFTMIRPFNAQNGETYEFEIDAIMSNGSKITLRGRSCYPIIECEIL